MNIGEVVKRTGVSEHTIRYYEKIGLLPPIRRDASGQRQFSPQDLLWLEFMLKLRSTGMPNRQMLRYADMVRQGESTLTERRRMLEAHERKIAADLARMQECRDMIRRKLTLYRDMEAGTPGAACCITLPPPEPSAIKPPASLAPATAPSRHRPAASGFRAHGRDRH